ncbi:MAG: site-specific DNA-methyltransferase [Thiobacillus sp.]|nr:site-specific DNA-methyltransferase [Thiobacillus sp.]
MAKPPKTPLSVEALKHDDATRKNIPTAEYQSVMQKNEQSPVRIAYERRNRDLDPQLVWRGKDQQDWSDLVVHAPPLYIQEKVHPKVLIDDLKRFLPSPPGRGAGGEGARPDKAPEQIDLFADFNGLPGDSAKTEFYQHDAHWANRMILGDSLQVMASLAEREGLRGQVQCIYFDPPYGIKFNSNFQWSTTSRDVKDGNTDHITREPEQVKAFRDTWRDGIHSYLTYLRDRLTVARDLLTDSGSIFVQIGDENVHRVRAVMDEVFGDENFVDQIIFQTSSGRVSEGLDGVYDVIVWYAKDRSLAKFRRLKKERTAEQLDTAYTYLQMEDGTFRPMTRGEREDAESLPKGVRRFRPGQTQSQTGGKSSSFVIEFEGKSFFPPKSGGWRTTLVGFERASKAARLMARGASVAYRLCDADNPSIQMTNIWTDTVFTAFGSDKAYIVQTNPKVIERCLLMSTDPGDLVLDPTCGSGTTAYVAEQWGRRWITLDTSRVALALARARIMGARYPYYLLADSRDGQIKEAEVTRTVPSSQPTRGNLRHGFVYERVPHITLKSIANNTEIDVIWDKWQAKLEPLREQLNQALGRGSVGAGLPAIDTVASRASPLLPAWQEWEIPRDADTKWSDAAKKLHADWWQARIARQKEIDASIAAKAEFEYLYDKPYEDKKKVRVAGPFTVESLSPHRVLAVDENDELIDKVAEPETGYGEERGFVQMILENLKTAGVQQAHKEDKISFTALTPWPGNLVCAEGRYLEPSPSGRGQGEGGVEGGVERRAAIFIGPEFGTVSRPDLVEAAREAGDADFDVLIACAFNYDAHSSEFDKLGRIPVLKARMNADLHMAEDLKNTGKGNLFVIFGEPDIDILEVEGTQNRGQVRVKVNGVDVFHPNTGEVRSDGAEGIACWFIDTDYNMESFFVRHAYFLGANDPYKALKNTLKAEINEEAWATLNSDTSRPFDKPKSGRIAVKVINHLGDEVMKVFRV